MNYYVEIKRDLLGLDHLVGLPTGKTRTGGGRVEAQFLCISPNCTEREIWASKDELICS